LLNNALFIIEIGMSLLALVLAIALYNDGDRS